MKTRNGYLYVLLILLSFNCGPCSSPVPPPSTGGGPGFEVAYFQKEKVEEVINVKGCQDVRFYNIRRDRDDTEGSAVMIPAETLGRNLYDPELQPYIAYDRLSGRAALWSSMLEEEVIAARDLIEEAGDSLYAASFPIARVGEVLKTEGCTALKVAPKLLSDGSWTMVLTAVSIEMGIATEVGRGREVECGEPCPVYCGHMPLL